MQTDMKTFKEYINETSCRGNYVAINAPDLDYVWRMFGVRPPKTGSSPPRGDYHCTLVYSKESNLDPTDSLEKINSVGVTYPILAGITHFSVLTDSDTGKACLVANLNASAIHKLHDVCRGLGMGHSYTEYSPHITLRYGMDPDEAEAYVEELNMRPVQDSGAHFDVRLEKIRSERVNNNYI